MRLAGAAALASVLVAGCGSGTKPVATTGAVRLPSIQERFTVLPCPKSASARGTTVGIEGCLEHKILHTDAAVRAGERAGFSALVKAAGRRAFARGERGWLLYREKSCRAEASQYGGGTIAPVIFAHCVAAANRAHIAELAALLKTVRTNG